MNQLQLTFICSLFSILFSSQRKFDADVIIYNANIYTVDSKFSKAEAMAILEGKIRETGTNEKILEKYHSINKKDLKGKTVLPGFIDAHCHFTGFATDRWKCELWGTKSWEEILDKIQNYSKNAPTNWIYGRSWDQNDWPMKEFPEKTELDRLFPNRPVYLKRIDGHAAIANQKALDIAGITTNIQVAGGEIEVKKGKLTGILIDNAMLLVEKHIPEISDELAFQYYSELQKECISLGLTSVHDCGISEETLMRLQKFQKNKNLKLGIYALLEDQPKYYQKWTKKGRFTDGKITVGGFKIYSDGALGSRGACLLHDYSDKSGWKGFMLSDLSHFESIAAMLYNSNLQMCTHAIGDSANRNILDIYGKILKGKNDRRWRIEHAQVVDPKDFHKFRKFSIIPSVQPTHATSDMYWAEERLGFERLKTSYAYRELMHQNGWMPLGTDFPVEGINPLKTFFAAVFRKNTVNYPPDGFQSENALTREEALQGMTIWAAKSAFQEKEKGSLEPGKEADFIIIDQDLMKIPENKVLNTKILETWIGGKKEFKNWAY